MEYVELPIHVVFKVFAKQKKKIIMVLFLKAKGKLKHFLKSIFDEKWNYREADR